MISKNTKSRFGSLAMVLVLVTSLLAGMPMAVSADEEELEEPEYMLEVDVDDDDVFGLEFYAEESVDGGTVDVLIQGYGDEETHNLGHIEAEVDDDGNYFEFVEEEIEAEVDDDEEYDLTEEEADDASFGDYDEIVVSGNDDHDAYMTDLTLFSQSDFSDEGVHELEVDEDETPQSVYFEVIEDGDLDATIQGMDDDEDDMIAEISEEVEDGDTFTFDLEGSDADYDEYEVIVPDHAVDVDDVGLIYAASGGGGSGDVSEIGEEVVMGVVIALLAAGILGVIAARD